MTLLVARCLLVGAAILSAGAAVGLPLAGWSRVALLSAAVWCALLDVVLVRSARLEIDTSGAPPPLTSAGPVDSGAASAADGSSVVLGTAAGGDPIVLDDEGSVVVVGTGALAVAVFSAVATQVRARARSQGRPVRVASAPDLRAVVVVGDEHCPVLPGGHAVLAVPTGGASVGASGRSPVRASGRLPVTSVVLVAGPSTVPRRWDVALEVSRSGCAVRYADETRLSSVSPVLPLLSDRP